MSQGRNAARSAEQIVNERLEKHGRALALEALARLMQKTPVDTGHARGNWFVQEDEASSAEVEGRMEAQARAEGAVVISDFDIRDHELHLTNNVPYIERLENGWSKQAPQGMAKLTVEELRGVSDRIAVRLNRG